MHSAACFLKPSSWPGRTVKCAKTSKAISPPSTRAIPRRTWHDGIAWTPEVRAQCREVDGFLDHIGHAKVLTNRSCGSSLGTCKCETTGNTRETACLAKMARESRDA